jgi:TonB family protein
MTTLYQSNVLSRRAVALGGIASFHVLIAYLLLNALVQPAPLAVPETLIHVLPQQITETPARQQPDVHPNAPHIDRIVVPPLDPPVAPLVDRPSGAVAAVFEESGDSAAVAVPLQFRQIGSNQLPNTADYYPPGLIRQGIEGATNLRVCVDAQGMRQGEPALESSSGSAGLDRAALEMARHGRYARALQGDTPVGNCYRFRIVFRIPK